MTNTKPKKQRLYPARFHTKSYREVIAMQRGRDKLIKLEKKAKQNELHS